MNDAYRPQQPSAPGPGPTGPDAYKPAEIGSLIEAAGIAKTKLPLLSLAALGGLAGAFISFGALFYLAVLTGADPAYGPVRAAAGIAFSLGLVLVIVGGAELFTGNALLVMAWVDGRVTARALARNWIFVYLANFAGAGLILGLAWLAGLDQGPLAATAAEIAVRKVALGPAELLGRGILCNVLVCLAVWLSFVARDAAGKVLVIVPPIAAFVALGFEHSVANMFLLPFGLLAGAPIGLAGIAANLFWVTLGNLIGGGGGVAVSYWAAYLPGIRPQR
jgi:formate/nitrite transporter